MPHDWSIEGEIDEKNPAGGFGGFYPGGIGWYRRVLAPHELGHPDTDRDGRVRVRFDGVYWQSTVWCNGQLLGFRPNGFLGFSYDITSLLEEDRPAVLAVRVDNELQPNCRWYTGSGIYRHVWIERSGRVAFDPSRTAITASFHDGSGRLVAGWECRRDSIERPIEKLPSMVLHAELSDGDQVIAGMRTDADDLLGTFELECPKVEPWSPDHPKLYSLALRLADRTSGALVAGHHVRVGFRTVAFDPDRGLILNGRRLKMRGVCEHQDSGPFGTAVPDAEWRRRLEMLKAMGCNAIRLSHNPPAPELLDLTDEMGFLVIDELYDEWRAPKTPYGYSRYFDEWWERDLSDWIRRDRNHASVILWSLGNEVREKGDADGVRILRSMRDAVRTHDPSRPVTAGCDNIDAANESGFAELLDVVGYNGGGGSCFRYEQDHLRYPKRRLYASEVPHTLQTRGVYRSRTWFRDPKGERIDIPDLTERELFTEPCDLYRSSYDNATVRISARDSWRLTRDLDFIAGEFRWTGFDYLGEAPRYPLRAWHYGIIDLAGFPKDTYHYYRSQWRPEPMVHVLPHWTHPSLVRQVIPVWVYTNCDTCEIFLNGRSLGRQEVNGHMHLEWRVPYEPGELRAVGYQHDHEVAEYVVRTAEAPRALALTASLTAGVASPYCLVRAAVEVVDARGTPVPWADSAIRFTASGPVAQLRTENGDALDLTPASSPYRRAFRGCCAAFVVTAGMAGRLEISAQSEGLSGDSAVVEIDAR